MSSLRVGLVGAGRHASEVVVPALRSTPGLELAAICSRGTSALELARTWEVEGVEADVEEFLRVGGFDAVVLCASPEAHETALALAPELGVPVFVETPPAFGPDAVRSFAEANAARETPVPSFVDFNLRYAAMSLLAAEQIDVHGRISHITMDCHAGQPRGSLWDKDPLDSFLLAVGVQPLAVMAELLGLAAPDSLTSAEVTQTRRDDCFVTADFTTRTTRGSLRMSNTRNRFVFETTVTCRDGWSVVWNLDEVHVFSPGSTEESRRVCSPFLPGGERGGAGAALREFRDAVTGKSESTSSIERSLVVMEWVERLRA